MTGSTRFRLIGAAVLGIGAALTACRRDPPEPGRAAASAEPSSEASGYPVRLRDDRGAEVVIAAEARRIVSLLPSHTETLVALGLGSRVVGVDDYSDLPSDATGVQRLGGLFDTPLEVVLSLRPDLVLCSATSAAADPLARSGVSVWAGEARSFEDIFRVIRSIGRMVGRSSEAKRLSARIAGDIAAIEDRVRGLDRPRVYYEIDANLYAVGPSSFIGVMLDKAAGTNIVPAGQGDFPKISPEAVMSGNPSIILGVSLEDAAKRPGWRQIEAVRAGRVFKLSKTESQLIVHPGPHIAEGLRALVRRLHPEVSL